MLSSGVVYALDGAYILGLRVEHAPLAPYGRAVDCVGISALAIPHFVACPVIQWCTAVISLLQTHHPRNACCAPSASLSNKGARWCRHHLAPLFERAVAAFPEDTPQVVSRHAPGCLPCVVKTVSFDCIL
jgi:hypothetical protein